VIEVDRLASAPVEIELFADHAVDVPREPHGR
jgi:hypothetical protein